MKVIRLRSSLLLFLFSFQARGLCAQQSRFVYIQTENKQPFYVKMDKKILSSSASGYIIISKLIDSSYDFSFGFPKKEWPEQKVTITVKEADAGYLLKNFKEKGWGLANLQTMVLLMPEKKEENGELVETELAGDAFSTILAAVVNDPTIAQKTIIKADIPATEKAAVYITGEKQGLNKSEITRLKYDITSEGVNMVYLDILDGISDTIILFIPAVRDVKMEKQELQPGKPGSVTVKDETENKNVRFIDMELQNPNRNSDSNKISAPEDSTGKELRTKEIMAVPGCKNFASREDFLELRKQMAVTEDYEEMINVARKKFKKNCFTTEQVKNLSTLFLRDEGKYKFFTAVYPYVSDVYHFASLEQQLTDTNFITKFKAILHH